MQNITPNIVVEQSLTSLNNIGTKVARVVQTSDSHIEALCSFSLKKKIWFPLMLISFKILNIFRRYGFLHFKKLEIKNL